MQLGAIFFVVLHGAHFKKICVAGIVLADVRYLAVSVFWLPVPPRRPSSAFLHNGAFPHELDFSAVFWLPKLPPVSDICIFCFVGFPLDPTPPVAHDGPDDLTAPAAYIAGHDGAQLVSL